MNIVILGAAGRTGKLLVDQAVAAGHSVTAFVRSEDGPVGQNPTVTTIVGDARIESDLQKAFSGQDAVISTLGSNKPGDKLIAASTAALINAAGATNIKRVIIMSSFLATKNFQPNKFVKFFLRVFGHVVSDILSGEEQLLRSDLDFTIVFATRLTNDPLNPHYRIVAPDEAIGADTHISRADVAEFLIKQLTDTTFIRKTVLITDNK